MRGYRLGSLQHLCRLDPVRHSTHAPSITLSHPHTSKRSTSALPAVARGLILIASLVIVGYVLRLSDFGAAFDRAWVDREVLARGAFGIGLFIAIAGLFIAVGLPRQIFCFLGGYAYGFAWGTALALAATTVGCIATFYYARLLGRDAVRRRYGRRLRRFDHFLGRHPFSATLVLRLIPITNNFVVNLLAGMSSVRGLTYVASSALGFIPQTLVFVLVGTGVHVEAGLQIALAVGLFAASAVIGLAIYHRYRGAPVLDVVVDPGATPPTPRC